ncbi:hypothetical protein WMY93_010432 [Mugilogobius chulae]|uniref:Multidrug and toxin extrusion protein 1 n=1 Tax=Mugilogobius chulae TaxID=88201 RepID=A0AAW0P7I0_9GOBI
MTETTADDPGTSSEDRGIRAEDRGRSRAISQSMSFLIGFVSTVFCGHLGKTDWQVWLWQMRLAQLYVKIFMPALPAAFMFQLQVRYLQNQGIIWPQVITGAIGNILNVVINYFLLFYLDLGVIGSAAANLITQYLLAGILFGYIYLRGLHKATWSGWSLESLQEWGSFLQLAIPSLLMLCLEFWVFEVGVFLAGLISEVELGAQSVVYQLIAITFMIPLGLSAAASVRVGNALGAGNCDHAKLSSKVPILCAVVSGGIVGALMIILRNYIGYLFTNELAIVERVSDVMLLYGFMHAADAVAGVSGGVLRGVGKQKIGAVCNLVGYYVIGVPVGVSLMFAAKMGIVGSKEAVAETADNTPSAPGCPTVAVVTVGASLPLPQLLLRRGLALLVMLLILCAGIVANTYLLKLLK